MSIKLKDAYDKLNALINREGYNDLSTEAKQQALFDLAKEVSADTSGSKTVFYSGNIEGTKTEDIAKAMAKADSNVRIISKTEVGQFFYDIEFKKAKINIKRNAQWLS